MTNKSLSEQICEVCGIKPEIIEDYDNNQYELYPDFENNNDNFIKLMELEIPHKNNKYKEKEQECEELKKQLETSEKWRIKSDLQNARYRRALEKIEKIVNEPCVVDAQEDCKHCDVWCEHKDILDIISRAKGEE